MSIFMYGETEIQYLKSKDKKLKEVIDKIEYIQREINPDLFSSLVNSIIGQQISTKAQNTIWLRIKTELQNVTPETINDLSVDNLQKFGITFKKAGYIKNIAEKVIAKEFDIDSLVNEPDDYICKQLVSLDGIGIWTSEMLMIFSMQRPNILSFGDLAIHRGLRMLYHHREIKKDLFEKYRRRYSPYASVASLYLWAIAGGQIDGMKDYKKS